MLIQIHAIQNHSPANLNRDDLGAPKTCYFGGVLRSRISSQCLKRSIRTSPQFQTLLGAVRTRRLAQLIAKKDPDSNEFRRALAILEICGIAPKEKKGKKAEQEGSPRDDQSAGLVFVTNQAVAEMSQLLATQHGQKDRELARAFAEIIARNTTSPDMALCGRMLEPKKATDGANAWEKLDTTVEAALQVAHAISTHEARQEVDYYVAHDDVPGENAGAAFVDEAMFASACFYKYFSIDWEQLVKNLSGYGDNHEKLAAHTVAAFIRAAALANPTGKQNAFAAHNPPDGILIEFRDTPLSYANAFAKPVDVNASIGQDDRDVVSQSIAQLAQYAHDLDTGYGKPRTRLWFSPNLRHQLSVTVKETENPQEKNRQIALTDNSLKSLDELIPAILKEVGHNWEDVKKIALNPEAPHERKHTPASL